MSWQRRNISIEFLRSVVTSRSDSDPFAFRSSILLSYELYTDKQILKIQRTQRNSKRRRYGEQPFDIALADRAKASGSASCTSSFRVLRVTLWDALFVYMLSTPK